MGTIGTFLKGAVAGAIGLGIISWFYATIIANEDEKEGYREEK